MKNPLLPQYEVGSRVEYRHRGTVFIGFFLKAQRRAAVIEESRTGRPLTVPWGSVIGPADGKKDPHGG
jgi:hypothetical protein